MPIIPGGGGTEPGVWLGVYQNAGAPTNGTSGTLAGIAPKGSLLADVTNAALYQNGGTQASPTWNVATSASSELVDMLAAIPTAAVADVSAASSVAAAGATPTKAEYDVVVTEANALKTTLNALLAALRTAGIVTP